MRWGDKTRSPNRKLPKKRLKKLRRINRLSAAYTYPVCGKWMRPHTKCIVFETGGKDKKRIYMKIKEKWKLFYGCFTKTPKGGGICVDIGVFL